MSSNELGDLLDRVEALQRQLEVLQETYGGGLAQLALVDWQALARDGHLGGTPRLAIERTIEDARNVLSSGQEALAEVTRQAVEAGSSANPDLDIPGRLQAVIRLYSDTPSDLRNRCQRLTQWIEKIGQSQRQAGSTPLAEHIAWPGSVPLS